MDLHIVYKRRGHITDYAFIVTASFMYATKTYVKLATANTVTIAIGCLMYVTYVRSVRSILSAFNYWLASVGKPFH